MGFRSKIKARLQARGGAVKVAADLLRGGRAEAPSERGLTAQERLERYESATAALPAEPDAEGFVAVATLDLVSEGSPSTFQVGEWTVAAYRHEGRVFAIDNACTHEDGPLGESDVGEGGVIACPYHDWKFRLEDGACLTNPRRPVACYGVKEVEGFLWIGPPRSKGTRSRGGEHDDGLEMSTDSDT